MYTVLIIEDEKPIRDMLKFSLSRENYQIVEAASGQEAEQALSNHKISLIILDWMLPDTEGPEVLKWLRKKEIYRHIPVIMLTAKTQEQDKIKGLDNGADDYMTKPVSVKELQARMRALIRRQYGFNDTDSLVLANLEINPATHELKINNTPVEIGNVEFQLLMFFMSHQDRVYSRSQLLDHVWGQNTFIEERTIDVHILRLRKILKPHHVQHYVQTVRGVGYRFSIK